MANCIYKILTDTACFGNIPRLSLLPLLMGTMRGDLKHFFDLQLFGKTIFLPVHVYPVVVIEVGSGFSRNMFQ